MTARAPATESLPTGIALADPKPSCDWCEDDAAAVIGTTPLCLSHWEYVQLHRGDGEPC